MREQRNSRLRASVLHARGVLVRAAGNLEVEVVGEERLELRTEQPPLREHGTVLLHVRAEMGLEFVIHDDNSLAEQRAAFRAAAVEHVGEPGDVLKGNVAADRLEAVGQARAVDEQVERELVAYRTDGGELGERVDGTRLRRHGKIDHLWLRDMFGNDASRPVGGDGAHLVGADFAIVSRCGFALVARMLDRSGLVHVDVPRVGADDALPWAQGRLDDDEVRLRAANKKVHIGRGRTCTLANQASRALAHLVAAIAAKRLVVNSLEHLENLGERAFAVIAVESDHEILAFGKQRFTKHIGNSISHQRGRRTKTALNAAPFPHAHHNHRDDDCHKRACGINTDIERLPTSTRNEQLVELIEAGVQEGDNHRARRRRGDLPRGPNRLGRPKHLTLAQCRKGEQTQHGVLAEMPRLSHGETERFHDSCLLIRRHAGIARPHRREYDRRHAIAHALRVVTVVCRHEEDEPHPQEERHDAHRKPHALPAMLI